MIYSSACEYAIRACAYLAARSGDDTGLVKLGDISRAESLPAPFLSSILNRLVAAGLLKSSRGPAGGYALARPPSRITLHDIKAAVDGTGALEACAVGHEVCSDETPCPLHDAWKPIREQIRAYLKETTLADMAEALERKLGAKGRPAPRRSPERGG